MEFRGHMGKGHLLPRRRVAEGQAAAGQAKERGVILCAVLAVAENGHFPGGELHPDLVRAARLQADADQRQQTLSFIGAGL